jgi:hypothetical protein
MNEPTLPAIETMALAEIERELRAVSGTPYRSPTDIERRRHLWRRLDELRH